MFARRLIRTASALFSLFFLSSAQAQVPGVLTAIETDNSISVNISMPFKEGDSTELNFGALPAVKISKIYRHMNAMNRQYIRVLNEGPDEIQIGSVAFEVTASSEPDLPFDACGMGERPVAIPSGMSMVMMLCFFPTVADISTAQAVFLAPGGDYLFSFAVSGKGRELEKGEAPPFGAMLDELSFAQLISNGDTALVAGGDVIIGESTIAPVSGSTVVLADCRVSINGGGEIPNPAIDTIFANNIITVRNFRNLGLNAGVANDEINVGQHVMLDISVTCDAPPQPIVNGVRWTINGASVKDYSADLRRGSVLTTPITNADLNRKQIDFYWTRPGTHVVKADVNYTWRGQLFNVSVNRSFIVEINANDIDRQVEDFFIWNHRGRTLFQHTAWHVANPAGWCRSTAGVDFFVFHSQMLDTTDSWRQTFGPYPLIVPWNGTRPLPAGVAIDHPGRRAFGQAPLPSYYTKAGGALPSPCLGKTALSGPNGFASIAELATDMEGNYHGDGHVAVGGEMGRIFTSPKDPIFYRWHKNLDNIYKSWP